MTDRESLLRQHPIATFLERKGIKLRGRTPKLMTNVCPLMIHKEMHFCCEINTTDQIFFCHDCGKGGSVLDWEMIATGKTISEVLTELGQETTTHSPRASFKAPTISRQPSHKQNDSRAIVANYDYSDENGRLLYQVVRFEPKDFRQRRQTPKGDWVWDMNGASRVLFRLPKVLLAQQIAIVEGEKDVLMLEEHGFTATCNVGGAGKWLSAYSLVLEN